MCNCFTFKNPSRNFDCKIHNTHKWYRTSTCYGSDYNLTRVIIICTLETGKVKVQEKNGKLHTVGADKLF